MDTRNKLEKLQATRDAIETELQKERQVAARIEKDRIHKENEIKSMIEEKKRDISLYNSAKMEVDKIINAVGSDYIKDEETPLVCMWIISNAVDFMGQHTFQAGINNITSYFRAKKSIERGDK